VGIPHGTTVTYADITGRCDGHKKFPSYKLNRSTSFDQLFESKNTGSCISQSSYAKYKIHLVGPTTNTAWVNVDIYESKAGLGAEWRARCEAGRENVDCEDGKYVKPGPTSVTVRLIIGPFIKAVGPDGYQFCAPEGDTCHTPPGVPVAYGAGSGPFVGATAPNKRALMTYAETPCTSARFGSDPAPGRRKACFYKP